MFCESGWKPSDNGEELIISQLLADGGVGVVLRRERNVVGQSDIDAFLLGPSGVGEVEFKRITSAAKPQRSSQTHIERAIEQGASHVLLFVDRDAADADTLQRITDGIRSGLRDDEDGTILHEVSVLLRDGTLISRKRQELDNGGRF